MFKVIHQFYDLQDANYDYHVGDIFPRDGINVDPDRIAELSSGSNRLGVSLIAEEKENKPKRKK